MTKIIKLVAGCVIIGIALLLHDFYIDYGYARSDFIFSWKANSTEYESYVRTYAKRIAVPDKVVTYIDPSEEEQELIRIRFIAQYCKDFKGRNLSTIDKWIFENDPGQYTCSKTWIPIKVEKKQKTVKGDDVETLVASIREANPIIMKGVFPSVAYASENPSRSAAARSLWCGIILPIVLVAVGLLLILYSFYSSGGVASRS